MSDAQILTAVQMRAAEQRIFDTGTSVFELMQIAAGGAAEWVRRIAGGRPVTVLCGPGNNGGDGYVIAHTLKTAGNAVNVIAPVAPTTDAAKQACALWGGEVTTAGRTAGEVLVDCLFGSGLSRPLSSEHALLLRDLASRHAITVAIDVPSGIASDDGSVLNERIPGFDVTLALGAWKFAHWMMPGRLLMGQLRLVPIGIDPVEEAACLVAQPKLAAPEADAHKYTRGLASVVGGQMPGAASLSALAAMRAGAGYVKLHPLKRADAHDPGLVVEAAPLEEALGDKRVAAILAGPGLGRDHAASDRLATVLAAGRPTVLDADALAILHPDMVPDECTILATPHDGELETLCRSFSVIGEGRRDRALALARMSGMVVLAKGPDSFIAAPDGRLALAPPAPSWLSVAGSGDILAGIAVSRMAVGRDPFTAACEAVWLHAEAARRCGPVFAASDLAYAVKDAYAACL